MENFERGKDPKSSMGVGRISKSLPILDIGIYIEISQQGYYDTKTIPMKRMIWSSKKKMISLLAKETVNRKDLFKIMRPARTRYCEVFIEAPIERIINFFSIWRSAGGNGSNKEVKRRIYLDGSYYQREAVKNIPNPKWRLAEVLFFVDLDDDKMGDFKGPKFEYLLYNGNYFPVNPGKKPVIK